MKDIRILLLVAHTTIVMMRRTVALECYNCNASWSAGICLRSSRIETCPYRNSACMTIDTSVTSLKGEKSILFFRQCASKYECNSARPCKDIKLGLWRERPGLFVDSNCRPQCCSSDHCNHPIPTPNLSKTSTHQPTSNSRKSSKKCFELKPEFISKHRGGKPREKLCSNYGEFDSCFSLQAQVLDNTTRKVIEIAEWKDCATHSRDCEAIANRCAKVQVLAKARGAYVENCIVTCCDEDLCNGFSATTSPTGKHFGVKAKSARRAGEFSVLVAVILIGNALLRM